MTQLIILRNSLSQLIIKKKKIRIIQMMKITMTTISDKNLNSQHRKDIIDKKIKCVCIIYVIYHIQYI